MLKRTVCTTAALFLSALAVAGIPTGLLYDNLNNATQTSLSVSADGPLYNSFSTGSSAVSLDDVQLKLQIAVPIGYRAPAEAPILLQVGYWRRATEVHSKASTSRLHPRDGGGSITVALYADSSTSPGALLTTIGTLPAESLSTTLSNFDFPLGSTYPLSVNHRYWIGISTINGSIAGWAVAQDDTGLDVANEFWYANGAVHPNTDPPFQMQVHGLTPGPSPVPAPSALLLLLAGFAGAALYLRRNKLGFAS